MPKRKMLNKVISAIIAFCIMMVAISAYGQGNTLAVMCAIPWLIYFLMHEYSAQKRRELEYKLMQVRTGPLIGDPLANVRIKGRDRYYDEMPGA